MPNENLPAVAARAVMATQKPAPAPRKPTSEYRFVIRTPAANFRGERAGVRFYDGVGYTDDENAARACFDLGYGVSEQRWSRSRDDDSARREEAERAKREEIERANREEVERRAQQDAIDRSKAREEEKGRKP